MRSKKALINIISSIILQIVTIVSAFIIPKLIITTYGSNINGLVTSITQFLNFIILLEAGFGPVIKSILFKPIADKDKSTIEKILKSSEKIFKTIAIIFIVYIILLCIALTGVYEKEFDRMLTISLIIIISISTFSEYFFGMTYGLYLQAEQKSYIVFIIKIFSFIINTIVVFILIKCGANIQTVKLATALIYVIRPVLQNIYVKKKYKINLKKVDSDYKIPQKWDGLAQHIAYIVHSNTDVAILTAFGNLAEISVYSVYSMIATKLSRVVQSFSGGIDALFGDMIAKNEKENLNKSFNIYEGLYFTLITIVYACTLLLIVPFMEIYTKGINDANYIRPVFACFIIIAEFIVIIRQPYDDLVKVAGCFKETRIGAWVEAVSNIVISIILVHKLGIIGLAIGTMVAMFIRTIEIMCYASKHILQRSVWQVFKNVIVIAFEIVVISIIMNFIPEFEVYSYGTWVLKGVCVFGVSSAVVLSVNLFVHKNSFEFVWFYWKKVIRSRE